MSPLADLVTKSGKQITIGTGTGTKWSWFKRDNSKDFADEIVDQLVLALKNGFNHIDTADSYKTSREVGEALKRFGHKREDLWITSKFAPFPLDQFVPTTLTEAFEKALKEVGTDYFDLFLVHTPFFDPKSTYTVPEIWKELVSLKHAGKVRYIGVSNFSVENLEKVFKVSSPEDYPKFNQIEFHPNLQNQSPGIRKFCAEKGIIVEGYNPLCSLYKFKDEELNAYVDKLASKYHKTNSQILLKYTLQSGVLPITTSSNEQRIQDSLDLEFELTPEEVDGINQIGNKNQQRSFFPQFDQK